MRLTRLGWGCLALSGLTWLTAASTGNNLLYLLFAAQFSAVLASVWLGRLNLKRLSVEAEFPDQVFRGSDFPLRLRLRNGGRLPAFGVSAAVPGRRARAERVPASGAAELELRYRFPHRGLNRIADLALESEFPLGLVRHSLRVQGVEGWALPRLREAHAAAELRTDARASGKPTLRKGSGEELFGVREYSRGDDARAINWKLTAKTGRALVNEFCASHDDKITVRVEAGRGAEAERRIEEAASACRFHIDAGAEVRLETAEEQVDFGRGLLQLDRVLRALARLGEGKSARPAVLLPAPEPAAAESSPALRRVSFALMCLVYASLALIDDVEPWLLIALSPALPLGWLVQERRWRLLPELAWSALSLGALLYTVLVDWRGAGVTVANTHLLLYLLVNRLLTPLEDKHLPQVFLICFLAFFLSSGLTISLWYFAAFLGYLALSSAWLALASGAPWAARRRWAPGVAAAVVAAMLLAVPVFAALPRGEGLRRINPFLAAGLDKLAVQPEVVTGFSEGVSLGFFGELRKSSARFMRVTPALAGPGRPPPLYIRGLAYDRFDGQRWTAPPAAQVELLPRGGQLVFPARPAAAPPLEFWLYANRLPVIFTAATPWMIEGISETATFDHNDSLRAANPNMGGLKYRVHAAEGAPGLLSGLTDYPRLLRERFLQLPPDPSGRVAALAREITAGQPDALAKARAIERHLHARYEYTLYGQGRGADIERFLFATRKGNCEYFASAGAVLLRHAGVPARLVTGFLADEWNEYGRFYDVRQREAHAWVEAYVEGRGWVRLDPTPPQSVLRARADAFAQRLSRWWDAVQLGWYRHVIGYDQHVRSDTFRRLGAAVSTELLGRIASFGLRASLAAVALLGLLSAARWLSRRLREPPPSLFARAQAALERAGLRRPPELTAREYARLVAARRPELGAFVRLAELHYLERYGGRALSPEQDAEARRALADLRAAI